MAYESVYRVLGSRTLTLERGGIGANYSEPLQWLTALDEQQQAEVDEVAPSLTRLKAVYTHARNFGLDAALSAAADGATLRELESGEPYVPLEQDVAAQPVFDFDDTDADAEPRSAVPVPATDDTVTMRLLMAMYETMRGIERKVDIVCAELGVDLDEEESEVA